MAALFPPEAAAQDPDAAPASSGQWLGATGPAEPADLAERSCETAPSGGQAGPAPDGGAREPEKLSMAAVVPAVGGSDRKLQKPRAVGGSDSGAQEPEPEKLPPTAAVLFSCAVAPKPQTVLGATVAPGGAFQKLEKLPEAAAWPSGRSNENSKPVGRGGMTPASAPACADGTQKLQKVPAAAAVLTDRIQEKVIAAEQSRAVPSAVPVPDGGDRKPQKVPEVAGGAAASGDAEAVRGEESELLSYHTRVQWMDMCICPLTMVRSSDVFLYIA